MVNNAPNHIPMNIIGSSQTSLKILEDGDILTHGLLFKPINAPDRGHIIHLMGGG